MKRLKVVNNVLAGECFHLDAPWLAQMHKPPLITGNGGIVEGV